MGAVQMPKAPKMPTGVKAPKAPKLDPKSAGKAGDQVKKSFSKKKLLLILLPILLLVLAAVAYLIFLRMQPPGPSETMQKAIDAAFLGDADSFKEYFTEESRLELESAWSGADLGAGATRGSWSRMMAGILTPDELKPRIVKEDVAEDGETATVELDIDGTRRVIEFVKVDDQWLINVTLDVEASLKFTPADDITDEMAEELAMSDPESEMWWEEREAAKAAKKKEAEGGCLGCVVVSSTGDGGLPLEQTLAGLAALTVLGLARRRGQQRREGTSS